LGIVGATCALLTAVVTVRAASRRPAGAVAAVSSFERHHARQ
jgi:hypothetical protein